MKIAIYAKHTYENQITTEDIEQAVYDSGFEITEVVVCDDSDVGKAWAEQENIPCQTYGIEWNNIKDCKVVKTNKYGKEYNPEAPKDRTKKLVNDCSGMIFFWNESDTEVQYLISAMKKAEKRTYFHKPNTEFAF